MCGFRESVTPITHTPNIYILFKVIPPNRFITLASQKVIYILIYRVYCNIRCTNCNLLQRIYRNIFASIYCIILNVPIN